jgi:hypothetical protein
VINFAPVAPTRAALREQAQAEARNIQGFFERNTDRFEYQGHLGHGICGVSCKVMLKRERWRRFPWRRLTKQDFCVVKRSFGYREDHLAHEMAVLKVCFFFATLNSVTNFLLRRVTNRL